MPVISTTLEELKKKQITLADYLLMPELNHPYEIIDGEMVPHPTPIPAHQIVGANIFSPISQYVKTKELGVVLFVPVDIILQRDPLRTRQPDVLFIEKPFRSVSQTFMFGIQTALALFFELIVQAKYGIILTVTSTEKQDIDAGKGAGRCPL